MRLIILTLSILITFSAAAHAKLNTYVSILPQKYFLEQIAGDKVNIGVMVSPGASPATYEPKPKQMTDLSKTDVYFSIGVPFEMAWLPKFSSINKSMYISNTGKGIEKREMAKHSHHEEEGEEHHEHDHEAEHHEHDHDGHDHDHDHGIKDPHIWLEPTLVAKQAENMTATLCRMDKTNCSFYEANRDKFVKETERLDSEIKKIFADKQGMHFMVFHPSWGYFAERYGLHQIAVETEGKEPKPSELGQFIKTAKEENLKAIFVQPQFSKKAAELIAKETGAQVTTANPLALNWGENLIYVANLIAGNIQAKK